MKDTPSSAAATEARRRLAARKVLAGRSQADAADCLGVHPVTVNEWVRAYRAKGAGGRGAKPHPGRAPFLTAAQQAQVLAWLADPPTVHGFRTDLWTARRGADLICRRFGVAYHPGYLREWLAKRGYSPQKPAKRAQERDQAAIDRWRAADWPRLQKRRRRPAPTWS